MKSEHASPPDVPSASASQPAPLDLIHTPVARLFILSSVLVAVLWLVQRVIELPELLEIFRKVVVLAWIVSASWLGALLLIHQRRKLLWRVRRKLILSYVFLGLVPVALIVVFVVAGGFVLYMNLAAYVFHDGFDEIEQDVRQIADITAGEIVRRPGALDQAIRQRYENLSMLYPELSLAVLALPQNGSEGAAGRQANQARQLASAGAWQHTEVPSSVPEWLSALPHAVTVVLAQISPTSEGAGEPRLIIRSAVPTADSRRLVIVDVPVTADVVARLHERTQTKMGAVTVPPQCGGPPTPQTSLRRVSLLSLFQQTVVSLHCTNWESGRSDSMTVSLDAPLGRLYERVAAVQSAQLSSALASDWDVFLLLLVVLAVLFMIVQGSALVLGSVLARSITSAVHELFVGTERVRQGDFAHRIKIESRDQLGDLADSFNRMSASIEHLLHVQREKQRLDDELRIARDIQKSLLPVQPPKLSGLSVADLCEPAREVGGDYYDFFELAPRQLGVLVADVSGKGTSAALYMAELKGLMLALSQTVRSPRRLLIDLNRLLANHLDNRSFITMIYAIVDLEAGTLTCARAGHTPLLVVSNGNSELVIPDGMVLGLRLPGASERFETLLQEHTRRISPGDVIVLYTDGVTEAMDRDGELFGDAALAKIVSAHHHLDPAGIRERVLREVKAFVGDAEQHDDMTLVVLKMTGDEITA